MNIHVKRLADDPLGILLPYQRRWVEDSSRFKFGLMARQVGKDFSAAAEGIRDCFLAERARRKTTWLIAAPSERQSVEALEKWKEWLEVYRLVIADISQERSDPHNSQSLVKSTMITFPHGSRVIAVPGRPDTVRGFSANVLLTEALFFDDFDATWRAVLPSITNPLRGGEKKCRLISTPNAVGSKGHAIWKKNFAKCGVRNAECGVKDKEAAVQTSGAGQSMSAVANAAAAGGDTLAPELEEKDMKLRWSCHRVDIHDAVREGLPVDVQELREGLDDPDGWAQEYELEFLDQSSVLLPYELMAPCENPMASEIAPGDFWGANHVDPIYLGIDFGRKRDLTVCWALQVIGNTFRMTKEVLALGKMPTPQQVEILRPRIRRARRVCFDYTGPGVGMGDYLVKEFGEENPSTHRFGKIRLCTFTSALKVEMFSKLRMEFESRLLGVPVSSVIREDLHSLNRVATASGVTYRAAHTADGHADYGTALALALKASTDGPLPFAYKAICSRKDRPTGRRRGLEEYGERKWINPYPSYDYSYCL